MKKGYLLFVFYLVFGVLSAQPAIQWQKTFGGDSWDEAFSIKQTPDGGYITVGSTVSTNGDCFGNHGGADFAVLKLSAAGSLQWKKILGGTGNEEARNVLTTSDGGYLVTGYSESNNGDVSGNHGGYYDGWVVKLNSAGIIQWQKTYGGTDRDDFFAALQTSDNGFVLVGDSRSSNGDLTGNNGLLDFWIVKTSETGELLWQKNYGGSKDDAAFAIQQTLDGGFIVVGQTGSTDGDVTDNRGNVDFWVLKITENGVVEWQRALGGIAADYARDVIQTPDGGYVVSGYVGSTNSGDITSNPGLGLLDYWIIKLNNNGELLWQKTFGGNEPDYARGMIMQQDGSFILAGCSASTNGDAVGNDGGMLDGWLVKVDSTGELIWQKSIGGTQADQWFNIQISNENEVVLTGTTWSNDGDLTGLQNRGYDDFWILKLSPESTPTQEAPFAAMQLFPNPTTEAITLKVPMEVNSLNVTITDAQGRAVSQQTIDNGGTLNAKGLPPGIYQIAAKAGDRTTYFGKIEKL